MVKRGCVLLLIGISCLASRACLAFVVPGPTRPGPVPSSNSFHTLLRAQDDEKSNKVLDFLMDPYESKIPEEMKEEIYRAEGNTPAAKERTKRILTYGFIAISLVGCAFFNGFLTELRHSEIMEEGNMSLQDLGFGWVQANFLFRFLFLNKIGGGLALVSGAATGMLAEAELDSRRKNAELIWQEYERRRNEGAPSKKKKKRKGAVMPQSGRKKQSGKQAKRLGALSEVVSEAPEPKEAVEVHSTESVVPEEKKEGVMDKLKNLYDKADSMAASQALLLNKKLEEEGILEKITDESGLKVIGKEAAAKLQTQKEEDSATK